MSRCRKLALPLQSACVLEARPRCIPNRRSRSVSAKAGERYERAVAKRTQGAYGLWFCFEDSRGIGFCQTDVVLTLDGEAIVIECKLTDVAEARSQLALYVPVVSLALKRPARGVVISRHLTRESDLERICASLGVALKHASADYFPTVHWIGKGPI